MSVVAIVEYWKDRQGQYNYTFLPSDNSKRYFRVQTNNASDDDAVVGASGILPALGSVHPNTTIMTARSWDISNVAESPLYWNCEVSYSDEPLKPPQDPNPLNRAAVIRMKTIRYQKAVIFDRDNNPITNSANDFYEPMQIDSSRYQLEVEKNYAYNAVPSWVFSQSDTVNSSDVTITQLGQTLPQNNGKLSEIELSQIQSEFVGSAQILYRTVKFIVDIRPEGYTQQLADRGFRAIWNGDVGNDPYVGNTIAGGALYWMMEPDSTGVLKKVTTPQYLNGSGIRLVSNVVSGTIIPPTPDMLVYNSYDVYDQFDFNQLPWS